MQKLESKDILSSENLICQRIYGILEMKIFSDIFGFGYE